MGVNFFKKLFGKKSEPEVAIVTYDDVDVGYLTPVNDIQDNGEQLEVHCPHCEHLFEKMPSRKRKCPACKEMVFPRCPPKKKWKRLVAEKQAEEWRVALNRMKMNEWADYTWRQFRAEIKDGAIVDAFDFLAAPDCCEICREIEQNNPYRIDDLPKPVMNTHPFCRCSVAPHV